MLTVLPPGSVLAGRYEIIQLLGAGGMGTVYKAKDREVDRLVAVKLLRRDLAAQPETLQRFKQELILARQITHKNVIRIYDLGESEGTRFITMEYIEGQDLRTVLTQRGKLPPEEAEGFVLQVCRALNAAHSEGVIHRDLKPQNIMVDKLGKITVMDFGIARSLETPGMTQTGALIGTPEYMSPEQARGEGVDARSDVFALGIIFYELVTGKAPYQADSAMALLLKRIRERARPPIELEPAIPPALNHVIIKCLEIEPKHRFQSAREILQALETRTAARKTTYRMVRLRLVETLTPPWLLPTVLIGALVLLAAAGMFVFRNRLAPGPPASMKTITLLISDFDNQTQDSVFDGTLEPMMEVALEGASFINAYKRATARKIAGDIKPGAAKLEESLARLVAVREGIPVVIGGVIGQSGSGYVVSVGAVDANTGKALVKEKAEARSKNDVLGVVGKLAAGVRKALGDTTPESEQLAAAETFTATSLEAAHEYALAQNSQWSGRWDEATKLYLKAAELDPNMGRAYSGLAVMAFNTQRLQDADKYFKLALSKMGRMSEREKFRTRGTYYLRVGNLDKGIEELSQLAKQYPADSAGLSNLALAYSWRRDWARALEFAHRSIEVNPKSVLQRNNYGLFAMYAGDFDEAIKEQKIVLEMNPSFVKGYVGMALSQLAQGHGAEALATWQRLEKIGPEGASRAAAGQADIALYEGRVGDAVSILEKGVAADLANKSPDAAALKLVTLAHAQIIAGHAAQARAVVAKGLAASQETAVQVWAARDYIDLGEDSKALALAKQLGSQLGADQQAHGKLIKGEADLKRGKPQDAIRAFQEARRISDTWLGRSDLARAYIEAGAYAEADSEIEACQKRRGEATSAFLDEEPTFHLYPPLYYYLGRTREGLKSPEAAESYKQFLAIDQGQDPLAVDARRRLAAH